jgi:hypothetical protein
MSRSDRGAQRRRHGAAYRADQAGAAGSAPPPPLPDGRIEPAAPRPEDALAAQRLVSDGASEAVAASFARLSGLPRREGAERALDELVRETLRPLLQAWLDEHLPELVERLVRAEIARMVGDRPAGAMTFDKTYRPDEVEPRQYAAWERSGGFAAHPNSAKRPYTIMMPPPNVTGSLHMGHALTFTLQDILVRFERMRGRDALWQPGTDHAGIATEIVVTNQLAERQINKHDLGREKFIERVWEWKAESGGTIVNQLRRLGCSPDWPRERFTMDPGLAAAVRKVFVQLYREGLIYRDKRLVNWDPEMHTTISDLEVESRETKGSSGISATRSRARRGASSSSRRPGPRRCSATPGSRCIPTTSASPISSASRCGCRWSAG